MNPIFPLRYWNEEFLVVLQHNPMHEFNNIFVWSWKECKDPTFLFRWLRMVVMASMVCWNGVNDEDVTVVIAHSFSKDLKPLYPTGLFPTAFFLYKNLLVSFHLIPCHDRPTLQFPHLWWPQVLMPDTAGLSFSTSFTSLIRAHQLSEGFPLVGSYSLPEGGDTII